MIPALIYNNRISWLKSNFLKKLQSTNSGDSGGQIFINFWRWSTKLLLGTHTIWLSKQQNSIKAITTENGEDELIFKPAKLYFWDELLVSELCHHETNKVISPFFSQWDKLKNKWGSVGIIRGLWTKSPGVLKLSSTTSTTSLSLHHHHALLRKDGIQNSVEKI